MQSNSRHDLISQFNRRDPVAMAAVYNENFPLLYIYARKLTGNSEDAQDIVSNTFVKLFQKSNQFADTVKLRSFLFLSVRNACLDYLKHARILESKQEEVAEYLFPEPEDEMLKAEIYAHFLYKLHNAIQSLPEKCRNVFALYYFEGLTNPEIAMRLGISEKTVANQRSKAVGMLREMRRGELLIILIWVMDEYSIF